MRLHRFYISGPVDGGKVEVTDRDLIHQWKKVFRYNVGSQVVVFTGDDTEHIALIERLGTSGATLVILKTRTVEPPKRNVTLVLALIKKDNFEIALEKAIELGVSHIVPVLTEHSEKKSLRLDRLATIVREAVEQCGRVDMPTIAEVTTLEKLFESGVLPQEKVCFHIDPSCIPLSQYIATLSLGSLAFFIGPEGGFSPREIDLFAHYNVPRVLLSRTTLRAETAAIAAASALLLE